MKLFEKSELKLLWPFYLEYFISSALYLVPAFLMIYFLDIGFNLFQIGLIGAATQIATLIFEIPTGSFADLYGRKRSVLLGYFIEGICMLFLFFIKDFYFILLIFALWGFGATFSSGSKDAWIVDMINKKNKKLIHNFFNNQQITIGLGLVLSGLFGAITVRYFGISIIWLFSASCYLVSIILLSIFTKEIYTPKKIRISNSFKNLKIQTKKSFNYSYHHKILFYFIIALIISGVAFNFQAGISKTPLLKSLGLQEYQFGYWFSVMALLAAISPLFARKFLKRGKERKFIVITTILGAVINLFILFTFSLLLAIPVLLLSLFFYNSNTPAQEVYFHRFIPSKLRATIGSVRSMLTVLASAIALPVVGLLVDWIGPRYTIFISSLLMIPVIILYLKIKENKK